MKISLKIEKLTSSEKVFFFAYALYLIPQIIDLSFYKRYTGNAVRDLIAVALIILVMREFIFESKTYNKRGLTVGAIFAVLIGITWYIGAGYGIGQKDIAIMLIFVYAARRIPFKKICTMTLWVTIPLLAFIILSSYLGIIDNYIYTSSSGRVREYLGFRYALFPSMILYNITALIVYKDTQRPSDYRKLPDRNYYPKLSFITMCLLLAVNYWMYTKTDSRLSFILAVVIILAPCLKSVYKLISAKICGMLSTSSFVICGIASFWLFINYSSSVEWMKNLNSILGGRLRLGQMSLREYGFSVFGVKGIQWVGNGLDAYGNNVSVTKGYNYVDSFYILTLQRYGVIVLGVLILLLSVSVYLFWKKQDYTMVMILVLLAVHGIIDDLILRMYYNTFWFSIGVILMRSGQELSDYIRLERRKVRIRFL